MLGRIWRRLRFDRYVRRNMGFRVINELGSKAVQASCWHCGEEFSVVLLAPFAPICPNCRMAFKAASVSCEFRKWVGDKEVNPMIQSLHRRNPALLVREITYDAFWRDWLFIGPVYSGE